MAHTWWALCNFYSYNDQDPLVEAHGYLHALDALCEGYKMENPHRKEYLESIIAVENQRHEKQKLLVEKKRAREVLGYTVDMTSCYETFPCQHEIIKSDGSIGEMDGQTIAAEYFKHGLEVPHHFAPWVPKKSDDLK